MLTRSTRMGVAASLVLSVISLSYAQTSKQSVRLTSAEGLETHKNYSGPITEGQVGAGGAVSWNAVRWKANNSHSDQVLSPEIALLFGVSETFDIRITGKYFALRDEGNKLDSWRIGLGSRAWLPVTKDLLPYVGLALNYYTVDGNEVVSDETHSLNDTRGAIGLGAEAGAAYLVNEWVSICAGVQAEASVVSGKATVAESDQDVSLQAIGLVVGVSVNF